MICRERDIGLIFVLVSLPANFKDKKRLKFDKKYKKRNIEKFGNSKVTLIAYMLIKV